MRIDYINLAQQSNLEKKELVKIFKKVISSGIFVGGNFVDKFEKKMSNYLKISNCVSLNSGTDALVLALHASGVRKGDEVITTPNSFIALAQSTVI